MTAPAFTFIDLFAGLGGIRIPFEKLGGKCLFSSEIDTYCQDAYEENFGERPYGDITRIAPQDIPPHDVLLGGFPCQAFSIIGKREGFADTRGTLFFTIEKILEHKRPKAFLLENVKQLSTHDKGRTFATIQNTLTGLGYDLRSAVLNALDFGLPQKRERTYIVGFLDKNLDFTFPVGDASYDLSALLEPDDEVDQRYFASDRIRAKRKSALKSDAANPSIWHENKSGNLSALPYSCALRANASHNYLLVNGKRRLTEREMLRLQGFPESYKIVCSYGQTRKQAGNSVSVPVIAAIAERMIEAMAAP